jgi:homoserine O-acetyltransferase
MVALAAIIPDGAGWSASRVPRLRPAIALRSVQREAVMSDPAWSRGNYADNERGPQAGMRIARKLGTITYRSADEWRDRFARGGLTPVGKQSVSRALQRVPEGFGPRFAVETYLESQAEKFVRVFDPNCYLYLSRAMDCFDIAEYGDPGRALARAGLSSALVIGVEPTSSSPSRNRRHCRAALRRAGHDVRASAQHRGPRRSW